MRFQQKLLSDHRFITKTARLLRSVPEEDQIAGLQVYRRIIQIHGEKCLKYVLKMYFYSHILIARCLWKILIGNVCHSVI